MSAYAGKLSRDALETFAAARFTTDRFRVEVADTDRRTFLAREGGRLVGYATLRPTPPPAAVKAERPVELGQIYLEETAIGRGHGSGLMRACLDSAREQGFDAIWLTVWRENERALRFYEKWRFRPVGRQHFEFGSQLLEDVIMSRPTAGEAR